MPKSLVGVTVALGACLSIQVSAQEKVDLSIVNKIKT
jgi:hypothetical protein